MAKIDRNSRVEIGQALARRPIKIAIDGKRRLSCRTRNAAKLNDAVAIRKVTATMALPQLARPGDIANAVVFLSSDTLARHITGQTLVVAGGMEGRLLWGPEEVAPADA